MKVFNLHTLNSSLLSALVVAGLGFGTPALADLEGYAADTSNTIVRSNFNECVRTSSWDKSSANAECDPDMIAKAPEPAPEPVAMVTEPKRTVQRINLASDTYFGFDKAELTEQGKAKLDELAADMSGKQDPQIQITGYTDRIGSESYNMTLSQKRAEAVKSYLVSKGIQTEVIQTTAMGPKNPVVSCEGQRGAALIECLGPNRRTEVEFSAFEVVETK